MAHRPITDNFTLFFDYGVWIPDKYLDITGDINEKLVFKAMRGLTILDSLASNAPITIRLSTSGGDVYDGLSLYDAIRNCKSRVEIIGFGKVWSMGSVIMQAADPGGRFLTPNTTFMVHQGYSGITEDHPETVQRWAKEDKRIGNKINRILYERSKLTADISITQKQFIAGIQFDVYMDPSTAISAGLADAILAP